MEINNFWKGFINGVIAVRIESKDQYDSFMDLCENHKIKWYGGDAAKSFDAWEIREPELCILCENKTMCQASEADCLRWHKLIVKFNDLKSYFQLYETAWLNIR